MHLGISGSKDAVSKLQTLVFKVEAETGLLGSLGTFTGHGYKDINPNTYGLGKQKAVHLMRQVSSWKNSWRKIRGTAQATDLAV
jgi:hypothetical protein